MVQFVDHDDVSPPWSKVTIVCSPREATAVPRGGAQFDFVLAAFDANPCLCLGVNAAAMTASKSTPNIQHNTERDTLHHHIQRS